MPLAKPNLDDRTFQQFVDETKRMIPRYCPEWTDHNVSDPGITMIELFSWMVESMIYRLNRVPEKTYITLLDLLGVTLRPQEAAKTMLTFRLSAAVGDEPLTIDRGTTVANQVTGTETEICFQTDADLVLYRAVLRACLSSPDGTTYRRVNLPYQYNNGFPIFGQPRAGGSFYLIYDATNNKDLSSHVLTLMIMCKQAEGTGVDPYDSPLTWEAYCKNDRWVRLEIERDHTLALNRSGEIDLYLPPNLKKYRLQDDQGDLYEGYCVRCRYNPSPLPNKFSYNESPAIQNIISTTMGGLVWASHAATVEDEVLGYSNGKPAQSFRVARAPILPPVSLDEVIEVIEGAETIELWDTRPHFGESNHNDPHVVIDRHSGEVRFGPRIRERNGTSIQHGKVPPRGSKIRFRRYRTGGGMIGNVAAGKLKVLKQSVAYVDRVTNNKPATGGMDAETIEEAKQRALLELQVHARAVTTADFEFLARQAAHGQVARAHCVEAPFDPDEPPTINVYILPTALYPNRHLDQMNDLTPDDDLLAAVRKFLDERRMLTTRVEVRAPKFKLLDVSARVELKPAANGAAVRRTALEMLDQFLNPYIGGPDGNGWPFERAPYQWEIESILASVPGVARVRPGLPMLKLDGQELKDDQAPQEPGVLVVAGDFSTIEFHM